MFSHTSSVCHDKGSEGFKLLQDHGSYFSNKYSNFILRIIIRNIIMVVQRNKPKRSSTSLSIDLPRLKLKTQFQELDSRFPIISLWQN